MDRRTPTLTAFAAVAVLLLAAPAAAWTQWGGDAAHTRLWNDAPGLLDVTGQMTLLENATILDDGGPGLVDTSHGLVFMARTSDGCGLYSWQNGSTPVGDVSPCTDGRLAAYDAAQDLALVCIDGRADGPILHAVDAATGTEAWTAGPARPILDPQSVLPVDLMVLGCRGAALGDGLLHIVFTDAAGNHTIEAVRTSDGTRRWASNAPATEFAASDVDVPESPVPLPVDPLETVGSTAGFVPSGVTRTESGLLVTGRFLDGTGDAGSGVPAAAWFGPDGALHGTAMAETDAQNDVLLPMSIHGTSRGPLAATLLGDVLLVVDPARPSAVPVPVEAASFGADILAAPGWTGEALVVPGEGSAFLFGADAGDPARWGGHDAGRLQDILMLPGGTVLALVTGAGENATASLIRFDAATGDTLQRVPLPFSAPDDLGGHLTPLGNGSLLAWSRDGAGVLLAPAAADGPEISLSDAYPPLGGTVEVEVTARDDEVVLVAWGDGLVQEMEGSGRLSHGYSTAGEHTLVATAVAPDNTTRSSRATVHVGGFPPEEPNLIEILFGPDNWEITVTVIGGIISAIGLIVGFVSAYRGRHRLELRLKALDRIGEQGRREPFRAVQRLHEERQKLREQLAKGTLSDAQYTVLQNHAYDILESLRQRILGGFTGRVSDAFNHRLDLALRDGAIDPVEGEALLEAVDQETLGSEDRDRLRELVRSWQTLMAEA